MKGPIAVVIGDTIEIRSRAKGPAFRIYGETPAEDQDVLIAGRSAVLPAKVGDPIDYILRALDSMLAEGTTMYDNLDEWGDSYPYVRPFDEIKRERVLRFRAEIRALIEGAGVVRGNVQ